MSGTNNIVQVHIQKRLGTEYWTNVYHLLAADGGADLLGDINQLVASEKGWHMANVEFVNARYRNVGPGQEGTIIPLTGFGAIATQSYLPLFNVIRVDFRAPSGRPSRKYYRVPVPEGASENGVLSAQFITDTQTLLSNTMALLEGRLCDVDGQVLQEAQLKPSIAMRQLRRGSKRKQPVI